jgi:hypothetical protein
VQVAASSQQLSNVAVVMVTVFLVPMNSLMRTAEGLDIASNDFDMLYEYSPAPEIRKTRRIM